MIVGATSESDKDILFLSFLLRCKQFQVFFFGDFYVDAETVGVKSGFVYQFATGTGNAFNW